MRLMNDDLKNHQSIQDTKKDAIKQLEGVLMTEDDYKMFLTEIKKEDNSLVEISQKFADLTHEAKRILDSVKEKSDKRKKYHEIDDTEDEKTNMHHRDLPKDLLDKLQDSVEKAESLHKVFKGYQSKINEGITKLHDSKKRVVNYRHDASLTGKNQFQQHANLFSDMKTKHDKKEVFGDKGFGIYQDTVLHEIEDLVHSRTVKLENIIMNR